MAGAEHEQKTTPELWANAKWGDRAIAYAHALLCVLVAFVYATAPAPTDRGEASFDAVWLSVGALAAATAWRFHITRRRQLNGIEALAAASLVFTLLYAVVVSYQLRYDLPPALSLRAPTLVFLFVLLALEGLRFSRPHILIAGGFALAGWAGLSGFAIWESGAAGVTRDYTAFLTQPKILIGAVVEMALAICLMTAAIAVAVWRGRALLAGLVVSNKKILDTLDRQQDLSRSLAEEIAERTKANAALEQLAYFDALTTLPNTRSFRRFAAEAAADAARGASPGFSILLIDLDHFRLFNDGFGRNAGDAALRGAAETLQRHAPKDAKIARLGSDEFALLTPSATTRDEAQLLAENLNKVFAKPFPADDREYGSGVTIGAAVYATGDKGGCVLAYADMALNFAKQKGRQSVDVHDPATNSQSQTRLDLEAELRDAIANDGLELHYQPIFDTRSGALAGWEALARWPRADGGMTSPVEFIPIAEETGSIVQLGAWALTTAAEAARDFCDAGAPEDAFMSVNVSPRQLLDSEGLVEAVRRALSIYPHIKLEVTESGIVEDPARAGEVLSELCALGATLALDDFGTGASSLAMLGQFPFTTLKIDRSFVIDRSDHAAAFLHCIVGLARALNLNTVAEGVENDEDQAALILLGATYLQGFGLARPAPRDAVLSSLESQPTAAVG